MRIALVIQWLRAARADLPRRRCALRYAFGIALVQVAWVGSLLAPPSWNTPIFWVLAACEMSVPAWAERVTPTPWHPHHIAERYSLLTLITLGESVLSASNAVESAMNSTADSARLWPVIVGGLLTLFSCWWLYFEREAHELLTSLRSTFIWGYSHYFVFGAAAALGAGIAVAVDQTLGHAHISGAAAGAAVAIPAAVYLACLWGLHARAERTWEARALTPAITCGLLLTPLLPQPVLATGLLLTLLTGSKIALAARRASTGLKSQQSASS